MGFVRKLRTTIGRAIGGLPAPEAYYEAARQSLERELEDSPTQPAHNAVDQRDRRQLMVSARQLEKDYTPVGYGVDELTKYLIPREYRANTGDDDADTAINDYLSLAMEAERFDYAQAHDAPSHWRLQMRDMFFDGDAFGRLTKPRGEQSFYVQAIRADLIGPPDAAFDPFASLSPAKRSRFKRLGGVILDSRNRRVGWEKYAYAQDPTQSVISRFERVVPGRSMIHLYDPAHTDDMRGVTVFHGSINTWRDLKSIWDYERKNQEFIASHPAIVYNETGTVKARAGTGTRRLDKDSNTTVATKANPDELPVKKINGSTLTYLGVNEKMEEFKSTRPNATFLEFSRHLMQIGAWSVSMPYSIVFDAKELNGGALRFELGKAECGILYWRNHVMIRRLMKPWVRAKILEGIDNGALPYRRSEMPALCRGAWSWPELPTADEKYRTASYQKLLEAGVISIDDACEAKGSTHAANLRENARAAEDVFMAGVAMWERHGGEQCPMPLAYFLDQLRYRGANGASTYQVAPEEQTPQPTIFNE